MIFANYWISHLWKYINIVYFGQWEVEVMEHGHEGLLIPDSSGGVEHSDKTVNASYPGHKQNS